MIFDYLWPAWILAFFAIEGVALWNDRRESVKGETLSVHLRRWFRVDTHPGRTLWIVVSGVFFAWLGIHIAGGPL